MRYRDAKRLQNGDQIIRKEDKVVFVIKEIEIFPSQKTVRFNCVPYLYETGGAWTSLYQNEVE